MASQRKDQGLPLCQTQLDLGGFKMDPQQDTNKPISQAGGTTGKMYLRKGENFCIRVCEREVRNQCLRNN